jgi:2-methylcitrate dehydratase PrpD
MNDSPCMKAAQEFHESTIAWVQAEEDLKHLQSLEPVGDNEKHTEWQDKKMKAYRLAENAHKEFKEKSDAFLKCMEEDGSPIT